MFFFPETRFQNLGDVGQHLVSKRVADSFGGGGGQKHEGVAITLFGGVHRAAIVDLPEITAVLAVTMIVPEVGHAVVDDIAAARPSEQVADGEAMHHACRGMDAAHGIVFLQRRTLGVEIEEAAGGIDGAVLEEVEKPIGLFDQPLAMPWQGVPVPVVVVVLGHFVLHTVCCFGLYPCCINLSSVSEIS
ncbi:hypothetical protein D3C87_1307510 [compost metagenome]